VLRALAAQSGVRYLATIDQSAAKSAPGQLSSDEVRALGIVPFSEDSERLRWPARHRSPTPRSMPSPR
jgi:hypothetical protein